MRVFNFDRSHGVIVQRAECLAGSPEATHRHEFVELVYNYSGQGTHYIDGRAYPSSAGDMLLINYGETHAIESSEKLQFYNLLVKPEFLCGDLVDSESVDDVLRLFFSESDAPERSERLFGVHFSGAERTELEQMIGRMYEEAQGNKMGRKFVLGGYMRLVFASFIRAVSEKKSEPVRKKLSRKTLLEYLEGNFTRRITIASMADELGYHPAYLGRAFHSLYGMSVKNYLRNKRIEYAASLIEESEMSISEIIGESGYTNRTQFYRDFEAEYGVSPASYRETHHIKLNTAPPFGIN